MTTIASEANFLSSSYEELLTEFREFLFAQGKSPPTVKGYLRDVRFILSLVVVRLGRVSFSGIRRKHIEEAFADTRFTHLQDHVRGQASCNRVKAAVRQFFSWARGAGYTSASPAERLRSVSLRGREISALSPDECDRLLAAVRSSADPLSIRDFAMLTAMLTEGFSIVDVVSLDLTDFDTELGLVRVRSHRAGRPQCRKAGEQFLSAIRRYLRAGTSIPRADGPLFLSGRNTRITTRQVNFRLKTWCRRAGIREIPPAVLRQTFAATLYEKTHDIFQVQQALGHRSVGTTARYVLAKNSRRTEPRTGDGPETRIRPGKALSRKVAEAVHH
ncbi:MAG: tyrosine-type recombinase/integrase [Candidatus Brocadiia bacterium]